MALFHRAKPVARPGDRIETLTQEIGRDLLRRARSHTKGFFSSRFWSDKLMEWATKDPAFKVQLFRFVDVFPMLKTPEQIHDYLNDYLSQPGAIAVDCNGAVYVADTNNNRVERFNLSAPTPSGCLAPGTWPPPGCAVDPEGGPIRITTDSA